MLKHIIMRLALTASVALLMAGDYTLAEQDEISGVIGLNPVAGNSCIGVWVPLEADEAIRGVRWYNNDGTILFPKICISGGDTEGPGFLGDAVQGAELVQGGSSMWSEAYFDEDYGSDNDGLYVLFQLPFGSVHVAEGEGGGAAMGYKSDGTGHPGWLSFDGEDWCPLHSAYGFALEAIEDDRDEWTVVLERANKTLRAPGDVQPQDIVELRTVLLPPQPNPFNPRTKLRFTLEKAGHVDLAIYDLHGRLVNQVADGVYSVGDHVLTWHGKNDKGRDVASGVYLARLIAGRFGQTHRLVLVR